METRIEAGQPAGTAVSKRRLNRKMKLTELRNTRDGMEEIGVRAEGIYHGHRIERTQWCLLADNPVRYRRNLDWLYEMAAAQYRKEIKAIDALMASGCGNF